MGSAAQDRIAFRRGRGRLSSPVMNLFLDTLGVTSGEQVFERVRFLGFTNSESMKMRFLLERSGMVILEDGQQKQFLIRARNIQMIVIAPEPGTA